LKALANYPNKETISGHTLSPMENTLQQVVQGCRIDKGGNEVDELVMILTMQTE